MVSLRVQNNLFHIKEEYCTHNICPNVPRLANETPNLIGRVRFSQGMPKYFYYKNVKHYRITLQTKAPPMAWESQYSVVHGVTWPVLRGTWFGFLLIQGPKYLELQARQGISYHLTALSTQYGVLSSQRACTLLSFLLCLSVSCDLFFCFERTISGL